MLLLGVMLSTCLSAQEIYRNDKYSFSVQGPKNWNVINYKAIKGKIDHGHVSQPLITYYKNANNLDELINPTIDIYVIQNPYPSIEEFNKKMSKRNYQKNLIAYSLKTKPQLLTIGGKYGSFTNATYTVVNKKYNRLFVRKKTYAFPTKDYLFYVTFIDERNSEQNTETFLNLLESIKIDDK